VSPERRLVFGEVAASYDRHRPTYPDRLIDDLLAEADLPAGARALEVGAGTGKATAMMAARGVGVLAIEPSPAMAAIARANCAPYGGVELIERDFERWDPDGESFPLLYSAQAWHWIDPALRYPRAHRALAGEGLLAAFWNRADWSRFPDRDVLATAFLQAAPELDLKTPMHPANPDPASDDDWQGEIACARGFADPEIRHYEWSLTYTADQFAGLLGTLSEIRLMSDPSRVVLLEAVRTSIRALGEPLTLPMRTRLCLARAA
jgi:SAM-dependent methyltransferase